MNFKKENNVLILLMNIWLLLH